MVGSTPAELDAFRRAELAKWTRLAKDNRIQLDRGAHRRAGAVAGSGPQHRANRSAKVGRERGQPQGRQLEGRQASRTRHSARPRWRSARTERGSSDQPRPAATQASTVSVRFASCTTRVSAPRGAARRAAGARKAGICGSGNHTSPCRATPQATRSRRPATGKAGRQGGDQGLLAQPQFVHARLDRHRRMQQRQVDAAAGERVDLLGVAHLAQHHVEPGVFGMQAPQARWAAPRRPRA